MERKSGFIGAMFAVLLAVTTLQAGAAQQIGRDFNHMTTGFPLSGGHAAAACESCHTGGVFKGTPRACDGCHAVGRRVVATPKNDRHIVTDAPCESCHFNTATWLGVRYNHGSAIAGQCTNCHNGRQAQGKAASHTTGNKATKSCDNCHRTFAWLPSSWNHSGAAGVCSSCHVSSPDVSAANRKPASHTPAALKGQLECDSCHNYFGWSPNSYKHTSAAACSSCHNGTLAVGKNSGHVATTDECNQCHTGTTSWSGALGAKPAKHIPYNASVSCSSCHTGGSVVSGATLHTYVTTYACYTCHGSNTAYSGQGQETDRWPNFHESSKNPSATDCSASGCHRPAGSKGSTYINWD